MAESGSWPSAISQPVKSFATTIACTTAAKKRPLAIVARKIAVAPCIPRKSCDAASDWRSNEPRNKLPPRRKKYNLPQKRRNRLSPALRPRNPRNLRRHLQKGNCSGSLRRLQRDENPRPRRIARKKPAENNSHSAAIAEKRDGQVEIFPVRCRRGNCIPTAGTSATIEGQVYWPRTSKYSAQ